MASIPGTQVEIEFKLTCPDCGEQVTIVVYPDNFEPLMGSAHYDEWHVSDLDVNVQCPECEVYHLIELMEY